MESIFSSINVGKNIVHFISDKKFFLISLFEIAIYDGATRAGPTEKNVLRKRPKYPEDGIKNGE